MGIRASLARGSLPGPAKPGQRRGPGVGYLTVMRLPWACVLLLGAACGGGTTNPPEPPRPVPAVIEIVSGSGQSAVAATALGSAVVVEVTDADDAPIEGAAVDFNVVEGGGWVVVIRVLTNAQGRAAATWYLGPVAGASQRLEARTGTLTAHATAMALRPTAGLAVLGDNAYIEWIPGELPLVISAPHGGTAAPTDIPDRTVGTTTRDLNTEELARELGDAIAARLGKRPHVILCRLHRRKLDANREIVEGAGGNPVAERAWREYHGFIEASVAEVRRGASVGFFIDLHGHGHDIQRLELGYLIGASRLALPDAQLALDVTTSSSSLWPLVVATGRPFGDVLRGPQSLGARLEAAGYPAVPSPSTPSPGSAPYFDGGYSTQRHGTSTDNRFAGVQIEANLDGVRDTAGNRAAFASALVVALEAFLRDHGVLLVSPGASYRILAPAIAR